MLSTPWQSRSKETYDFVVVGSGYGGAITAARIAAAAQGKNKKICILERGKEWPVGTFPDTLDGVIRNSRRSGNPLGLYEMLTYSDISVIKGSGLGGTSLINANVAIVPDPEVFQLAGWPRSLRFEDLLPYYQRAYQVLAATEHPRAMELAKVQALDRRAQELGGRAQPLKIAVNFTIDGKNPHGVDQKPCIDCGDCVTGCNVAAKNTLPMNYLPMAKNAGAQIFTQVKVEWVERLGDGRWRIHGKRYDHDRDIFPDSFTMEAANVVLAAGSLNSTEILLRSETHGLSVSPALGTGFGGNGDFFGLAYNGDYATDVLGYGRRTPPPGGSKPPGPTIVSVIKYNGSRPVGQRIAVEDFSFPSAYIAGAMGVFGTIGGEDTDVGDEDAERIRRQRDLDVIRRLFSSASLYHPEGALNHTLLYLVMGQDDARGHMVFETPWFERDGRMRIEWDGIGRQPIFTVINEELRRHARASGASFIMNPTWDVFQLRHLITAHPLGGCPMGEDYLHGAVDEFGRLFRGDGGVHDGLYVADGAVIPSALSVNPLLTISAVAERIAERKIQETFEGRPYPQPPVAVSMSGIDAREVLTYSEPELERLFRRTQSLPIDVMMNAGGPARIDADTQTIENDAYWKGFFPRGHILNAMSSAIFTGFKKEFFKDGVKYGGITSDTDGRIRARNSLEEITLSEAKGTLEAGKYILLRYLDPPWRGYYDIFKIINHDLLIGRVYLGEFPNGIRVFTFPMTRKYAFGQMTVNDHQALWDSASVPTREDLDGIWRMDAVSNANHLGAAAYLKFDAKPDGRLESRYQLLGLIEGLVIPSFTQEHFQLNDFTTFHDEIRKVSDDFMVGKWITDVPDGLAGLLGGGSLGIFHNQDGNFGFHYTLTRVTAGAMPPNRLLAPLLNVRVPDGLGMTFDEEMVGTYSPTGGAETPCSFKVRMTVKDVNEFIDGPEHEARISGAISFGAWEGRNNVTFTLDDRKSLFNYLRVNPQTAEAEMRYHLEFRSDDGRNFVLEGRKYMQKDEAGGIRGIREVLEDYTTLYCEVDERTAGGATALGRALLKFRTFEDLAAVGNLAGFLKSFRITGTTDPILRLQAQMRFLTFTGQFVQQEYDPVAPGVSFFREDVQAEVVRGASVPDYFSTRPTADLQAILRDTPTQPLAKLINTGEVRIDFEKQRIFRDSFWKGSFAEDTILGWEERIRDLASQRAASPFAGGAFWKRFDSIQDAVARGHVVNYELAFLPGDPEVREVQYPNNDRRYFRKGDKILLLTYRNQPYRIVYDTIKVIDDDSAIGVMHLGDFPNGVEFSTFVMERNNYPFEKMSIADHRQIFAHPRATVPGAQQIEGEWDGYLVFLNRPNTSLLNRANPVLFRLSFKRSGEQVEGKYRFGLLQGGMQVDFTDEFVRLTDFTPLHDEIRMTGSDTMVGKWVTQELPQALAGALRDYLELDNGRLAFYYVLKRAQAGAAIGR